MYMKTIKDFVVFVERYKEDINNENIHVPFIRKGLLYFLYFSTGTTASKICQLSESIAILISVVEVIEKQVHEYIEGDLSHLSLSMMAQAKSDPVHSMFSEQTFALADHQFRKSPNSKVGFIDGKVKAKKNKTLEWGCLITVKKIRIKLLPLLSREHD